MKNTEPTIDPRARDLLDSATSDPGGVLERGELLLDELDEPDSRAVALRAMSIAARNASTLDVSVSHARSAANVAVDPTLIRECLGTLAGSMAMGGDTTGALRVLDRAAVDATGLIAAQLEFQRAFIHTMTGDYGRAMNAYDISLPLFRAEGRDDFVAMVLHNQGYIYTQTGRLVEAETALIEARAIEEAGGRHLEVAGTDHNLGLLASYRGDIPEALRRLSMSDEAHMRHTGDDVPRHVSRCEVLISAGLYKEALDLALRIAAGARSRGRAEDEADALLVAARAAQLTGDQRAAIDLSVSAMAMFEAQARDIWAAQAALIGLEGRYELEGPGEDLAAAARDVAERMDRAGLVVAAARARLVAGRIGLANGDVEGASRDFAGLTPGRSGPVEVRLQQWQATSMLRLASGDRTGAARAARAGLDLLDDYQASLGASDLRSGIERLGTELGELGLRLALDSARPRRVFGWMERTRARALRIRPVVPSEGDPEQPLLSELRRVGAELRSQRDDPVLVRRQLRLQEQLRLRNRTRRGGKLDDPVLDLDEIAREVGDRTLVEMARVSGALVAVVVGGGRFRLHHLGDASSVETELMRLRFDLRRTARLQRDPEGVQGAVARFDRMIFGGLRLDTEEVILVPPATLLATPWAVLPSLMESTLTVAPSAEIWLRARRRAAHGEGVVLLAGPDLENADAEIDELRRMYPNASVLGPDDPADAFGRLVRGSRLAHAACHASFEAENPMFSSLRLGDGDFNVYDMERVQEPPEVMVFSACDSGYTETRAGDELTGLTSALLSMGSRTVVASVGLVPDSRATGELMRRFHRGLVGGETVAASLSSAQRSVMPDPGGYIAAASFLCIGA